MKGADQCPKCASRAWIEPGVNQIGFAIIARDQAKWGIWIRINRRAKAGIHPVSQRTYLRLHPFEQYGMVALARRVLESVEVESINPTVGTRGKSSEQVLGLWSLGPSVPNDPECDQILAEELSRKHAS